MAWNCTLCWLQVELREAEAGSVAQLQLTATRVELAAAEPAAALEVVRQGEWVGLRSPLLDGLFLQARKKAPSLVFFSNRLGVWEQWKVGSQRGFLGFTVRD